MQATSVPKQVVSRVLAVLLLAVVLVPISAAIEQSEQEMFGKLTHQQLLEYLREGQQQSFAERYVQMALLTLVFLAAIEGVAFVLRCSIDLVRPALSSQPPTRPIPEAPEPVM